MAQEYCVRQIPTIGETQPSVLAWSDFRGGCRGAKGTFPANGVDTNLLYSDQYGIGANDIDSMWIPPNFRAALNTDGENPNSGTRITIDGTHTGGADINYPGLYQFDQGVGDVDGGGGRIWPNDVDIVSTRPTKPWSDHLYDCCANPAADVRLCGAYKPGAAVCKSRLQTCTGAKLKTDEGCQNMCRSDPTTCDKIKRQFCDANPNDRWCTCMNVEQNPDFMKLESKIIEKTGQSPRLACSPFGRCMTGTDLLDIYLPKNIIDDRRNTCPSYSSYLDQSVTTSGSGNIVNAAQTGNVGGESQSGGSGGAGIGIQDIPTSGSNNVVNIEQTMNSDSIIKGINNQTLLIVLGFVLLVIAVVWFSMADTPDGQMYPPMMPPMYPMQQPMMQQPMAPPMMPPMYPMQQPMQQPMYYPGQ